MTEQNGKRKLTEAAADVLAASIRNAGSESFGLGKGQNPAGIYQGPIDLGPTHYKGDEPFVDYTKGVPTATPPGQTPPVGPEPMKTLEKDRGEEHATLAKTLGFGGKVNPSNVQNGENGINPNLSSISKRQTNVTPYVKPGEGNKLPSWAKEGVEPTEAQINEIVECDESTLQDILERKDVFVTGERGHPKHYKIIRTHTGEKRLEKGSRDMVPVHHYNVVHKTSGEVIGKFHVEAGDKTGMQNKMHNVIRKHMGYNVKGRGKNYQEQIQDIISQSQQDLSEDVNAIFNGETLSDEFKSKATTIFEAAVGSRVKTIADQLEQLAISELDEAVETIKEELTSQVDEYLSYMVEEWITENEIAIEKGLRSEIVEDFIAGLRTLFMEHYIDIPEEKVDLVGELSDKVEELTESLDEEITKNIELKKLLGESVKTDILTTVCEGLTQTQVDKVKTLAESVEFTTEDEYLEKIETIRESYFPTKVKSSSNLDILNENQLILDESTGEEKVISDPLMKNLVDTISRMHKV